MSTNIQEVKQLEIDLQRAISVATSAPTLEHISNVNNIRNLLIQKKAGKQTYKTTYAEEYVLPKNFK